MLKAKIALPVLIAVAMAGCSKSIEEKQISELTQDEMPLVCSADSVKAKLTDVFQEQFTNQLVSLQKTGESFIRELDEGSKVSPDEFFKNNLHFSLENIRVESSNKLGITCIADFVMTPDYLLGKKITLAAPYQVIRVDGKFYTSPTFRFADIKADTIPPTEKQVAYDKREQELSEKEYQEGVKLKQEAQQKAQVERDAKYAELRKLKDSDFTPMAEDDLVYLYFAQSDRKFTDDDLLKHFSQKYRDATDAFVKKDLREPELKRIKDMISKFKDIKNIVVYSDLLWVRNNDTKHRLENGKAMQRISYPTSLNASNQYNFEKKFYPYNSAVCTPGNLDFTDVGIGISLRLLESVRKCELPMDEPEARELSAKLNQLKGNGGTYPFSLLYVHIDNIDSKGNFIFSTIVREDLTVKASRSKEVLIQKMVN